MNVDIFIPCFVDQLYPKTAFNMVKVLEKAGCTVHYNANQTCCGQPAFNAGFWDDAKTVCRKFLQDFTTAEYIVAPSASCVGFVKNYYKKLFENDADQEQVKSLQGKIFELSDFLVNITATHDLGAEFHGRAVYHDSCAALRECGIKQAPRQLLNAVKGLEMVEMTDVETCCGFGGTFAVKFEAISVAMADQKIQHALATGAEYIISTDLSCLMHLDGRIRHEGVALKTIHIADVLASTY